MRNGHGGQRNDRSGGQVLSVASECVPLIKTGGLADVVGALPGALAAEGWRLRTMLPAYCGLIGGLTAGLTGARAVWTDPDLFGGPARVIAGQAGGRDLLLLDAPHLYDRAGGPYGAGGADHPDNPERFAALGWAAAAIARSGCDAGDGGVWRPDIVHAHDWQAALAPVYLRQAEAAAARPVPSLLTIHNIAFQGIAPAGMRTALRLDESGFHAGGYEYRGDISMLKAGLLAADALNTVSARYADELMRPEFGMGLEGVTAARAAVLSGIVNGVDTNLWNPGTDPAIRPYGARSLPAKAANRAALVAEFGLGAVPGPLAIVVSRLTGQKGIDLLPAVLPELIAGGGGLVVLGTGEAALEAALAALARRFPGRVGLRIGYDEMLAHRMFAGGDAVLVPSRFEPCGLTQMYGLRYGAVPVVAATGGLADTVIGASPASLAARAATGISFHPVDALALARALRQLCALYRDRAGFAALQRRAMRTEVGWSRAAAAYGGLYRGLLAAPAPGAGGPA